MAGPEQTKTRSLWNSGGRSRRKQCYKGDLLITESDYEQALEALQNQNYEEAANHIRSSEDKDVGIDGVYLEGELERLDELVGSHSEMVSGALGGVLTNYTDRLIDDLLKKIHEGDSSE